MKVKYKSTVWTLLCPKKLIFPSGVIRNILIENEKGERIITHYKQVKEFHNTQMSDYF